MINESGTISGGGGKPRGGRMCLGKSAARLVDTGTAKVELEAAEADLAACSQVLVTPWRTLLRCLPLALCHNFQHTHTHAYIESESAQALVKYICHLSQGQHPRFMVEAHTIGHTLGTVAIS